MRLGHTAYTLRLLLWVGALFGYKSPEEMLKARNRCAGFNVSIRDFAGQPDCGATDQRLLERILRAYRLSKREQPRTGPYAMHGMWESILATHYAELIEAAQDEDLERMDAYLRTVFTRGSEGLSMSGDVPNPNDQLSVEAYADNYVDTLLHLATFLGLPAPAKDMENEGYVFHRKISLQDLWIQICQRAKVDPSYPRVGSPFGLRVELNSDVFVVPRVAARHLHTATRIRDLTADASRPQILEIGGGFGGVQYYIAKTVSKPFSILSLDVPEINMISAYFLLSSLPDVDVALHGEVGSSRKDRVIYIEPNWALKDMAPDSIWIAVNTDSLPEISPEAYREYLKRISEISKYFYSVNQECGREQHRLSQLNNEEFGLHCVSHHIAWMRHGYFERVYESRANTRSGSAKGV